MWIFGFKCHFGYTIVGVFEAYEANNFDGIGQCGGWENLPHNKLHEIEIPQLHDYPFGFGGENVHTISPHV